MRMMKIVIIAGGKGTRLGLSGIPKPMVQIAGKPILQHQIELAQRYGLCDILLSVGHLHEVIQTYFGDGQRFGVRISYMVEDVPMGTAGAVGQLKGLLSERFMVFYGDKMMDVYLPGMMAFDNQAQSIATLLVQPNDHMYDSDLLEVDSNNVVRHVHKKPHDPVKHFRNIDNACLYILDPKIFSYIPQDHVTDFGKDIFPTLIDAGEVIRAYRSHEYAKDVGTPERLAEAQDDVMNGKPTSLNKQNKQRAIFFDFSGVISLTRESVYSQKDSDIITSAEVVFSDAAKQAIARVNHSHALCMAIAPNLCVTLLGAEVINDIYKKIETVLGRDRLYLDDFYYCSGDRCEHGGQSSYVRTPESIHEDILRGLLARAARMYHLDEASLHVISLPRE